MSAPPKPWEVQPASQPTTVTNTSVPAAPPVANASTLGTANNSVVQPNATYSNYPRRNMYSSPMMRSPYSMYRGGYGGLGGYGGMYGGGMYGGGMYGGGMYGMYGGMGMGYGMDGHSRGMMAIERFSILVNSLCFTAETIEHSMHSIKVFWEALQRIKEWGASGIKSILELLKKRLKTLFKWILYFMGKSERPESEDISFSKVLLNFILAFIVLQMIKFCWNEFTSPSLEEMPESDYL